MKDHRLPSNPETRLQIKEPAGWFVAGEGFRRALNMLSDGAFRLFAYLSLQADRRTGCLVATHKDLAAALGKPYSCIKYLIFTAIIPSFPLTFLDNST